MERPKVGQIVYSYPSRHGISKNGTGIEEFVVIKVGRKYFYACPIGFKDHDHVGYKYCLESWKEADGCARKARLYSAPQECIDEKEKKKTEYLIYQLFSGFGGSGLSLDQLRRIVAIIEEGGK